MILEVHYLHCEDFFLNVKTIDELLSTIFRSVAHQKWGFPGGSVVKYPPANASDAGSIPGLGRSLGEGNGSPFQYSCLGNPLDRGARQAPVHEGRKRVGCDLATKQQQLSMQDHHREKLMVFTKVKPG